MNKWKIRLGVLGKDSRVELNGEDITSTVYSIIVETATHDVTSVTISYTDNEVDLEIEEKTDDERQAG